MNDIMQKIEKAKYIELVTTKENLFVASSIYTYILTLHKKVSLVMESKNIPRKYTFLPWVEKIKTAHSKSADEVIEIDFTIIECMVYLIEKKIKINQKMSTALYGGLLDYTNGFQNTKTDGMAFAYAKILVEANAEVNLANDFIMKEKSLSFMRLKGYMLSNMLLCNNATQVSFIMKMDILKTYNVTIEDIYEVMQEAFRLPYIKESILIDEDNQIIKIIKKEN